MELTQQDYNDRKKRVDDGTGDDEDARLVKLYEREGFTAKQEAPAAPAPDNGPDNTPASPDNTPDNDTDDDAAPRRGGRRR